MFVAREDYLLTGRKQVDWGAVVGGTLVALALLILSAALALACSVPGYGTYDPTTYGWGTGIWSIVTAAVAFFIGGCVASYMSRSSNATRGMLRGLMVWALALPLLFYLFAFSGNLLGHAVSMASEATARMGTSPLMLSRGAAWGNFISLCVGLIFAAAGGSTGTAINWEETGIASQEMP